ncbi:MAG: hypothetical protein EBS06_09545 [Proteobacteria bacterium]|nr:hypothetical protein [Pseudomonadota bacterium]
MNTKSIINENNEEDFKYCKICNKEFNSLTQFLDHKNGLNIVNV